MIEYTATDKGFEVKELAPEGTCYVPGHLFLDKQEALKLAFSILRHYAGALDE